MKSKSRASHFTFARARRMGCGMSRGKQFRTGLMALALGGGAALALAAHAGGISGYNSDAPVHFDAGHLELLDKEDRALLTGGVVITQADLRLTSASGVVSYTSGNGSTTIQRFDASGDVVITRGSENARGDVGIYDVQQHIITLVGNVELHRGADVLRGARLVYDLDSGVARVDGRGLGGPASGGNAAGPGRVSGTFTVPKKG